MNYVAILIVALGTAFGQGTPTVIESPTQLPLKACLAEVARAAPLKQAEGYIVVGGGCVTKDALPYIKKALGQ